MQRDAFAFWLLYGTPATLIPGPTEDRTTLRRFSKAAPSLQTLLEERFGERFEYYGGDDVLEPIPLNDLINAALKSPTPSPSYIQWDGPDDPDNPRNWSMTHRWLITLLSSLLTINVTFASSAPTAVTQDIARAFGVSEEVGDLATSLFLLGYVIGPMFWGPGSELVGRRPMYILTLATYTLFFLGQALGQNIETILVTRFFGGTFAVAPLVLGGGVLADIWTPETIGAANSLWVACVFLGPVLGPLIGGFMAASSLSWRWVFWVMMIFAGFCTICALIFLPETYAPVILTQKAKRLRKLDPIKNKDVRAEQEDQDWSPGPLIHRTIYRPLHMLIVEPILMLVTVYLSVAYGVLYALFEAFPVIFIETRHFTISQNGLIFLGVGIGSSIGALINYLLSRRYPPLIQKWHGYPPPEQRLFGAMIGGPCLVIGSFWLGWTGEYPSIPWYVPGLSTVFIGISISLIFISFLGYLIDTYLMYSASALSANTMVRSIMGAAFPLFTVQMFHKLGINWASTLIALIGLLLAPIPLLFYRFGAKIRGSSKYAPCMDLKMAERLAQNPSEKV